MPKIISDQEIKKRMQKLSNYENVLYPQLRERSDKLRDQNRRLKEENERLRQENKQIEKLQLQLEELRAMKFGKTRQDNQRLEKVLPIEKEGNQEKQRREASSYRRKEPNPDSVTDYLKVEIENCPDCGDLLTHKKDHKYYREDLYEVEDLLKSAKKIVETIVESGKCSKCQGRKLAMEIPGQKVVIGPNIRMMVVYYVVMQGLSYNETKRSLIHQYGVSLSNGELVNILDGEGYLLTPYYNYLVEELFLESRELGAHYDETSWKTRSLGKEVSEGNYAWIKVGVKSQNRLIWFGKSRGKGVAELLRGEKQGSKGVSDDYGAYHDLFETHELCWAHPNRKLRDLASSDKLSKKKNKICQKAYKDFSNVYKKAEKIRQKLLSNVWDEDKKKKEKEKLEKLFDTVIPSVKNEPEKLEKIKESLKRKKEKYFAFFDLPHLPLDNNKAERALRKIVIKRKKSFGSVSQKGANTLSILYSVIHSLIESNPDKSFFELYKEARDFEGQ